MSSYGVRAHTARKDQRADCGHAISKGERYLSHVEFPGGDAGYADAAGHPVRMKECAGCATRYDRGALLELKPAPLREDCLHAGQHCKPHPCPDCGRFSRHSWDTGGYSTQNGWNQDWGGTCAKHGDWSESAA